MVRPREQGLLSTSWRRRVPILSLVSRPADQSRKERVMTRSMFSDDPILLVNAYLDGELDPANALAIEQRMAADSALAAEYTRIGALQRLLRERLPREAALPGLRARISCDEVSVMLTAQETCLRPLPFAQFTDTC